MATNWNDFEPVDPGVKPTGTHNGKTDWSQFTPVKPDDSSDMARGFKESFQQLPQLGYGLLAGAGAAAESAFGEGGIATGIKKAGVAGYQDWGNKIAAKAKDSDSWDYSYDQAKQGNLGALVDWLQHGIGYVGGQGVQMLMTAGIGSVAGKFVAATAAKQIAEGMVAKSAAELAATEAGANLSAQELTKAATANVAGKFAAIGQNAAVGAMGFGQEGGEIFGDLTKQSVDENRSLSGAELGKAFAASLAAGALEFVGDKIGLDVILGKSALLKPAEHMGGLAGRAARGAVAAAAETPIEAGTEYLQTGLENYGKGNEANILPFNQSEAAQKDARESAMLGALGGTVIGGAGGMLHGAKQVAAPVPAPAVTPEAPGAPLAIGNTPDPLISFPDGTVDRKADVDAYVAGLPPEQRHAARSALMGRTPFESIADSQSVDEAIAAAAAAVNQPLELPDVDESALSPFMRRAPGVTQERDIAGIKLDADMAQQLQQREAELDAIASRAPEARAEFDAQQAAIQRAATVEAPSAMELALRRAAPLDQAGPEAATPAAPAEPRIVPRTPDMQPTSLAKAQAQADAIGGEVARVQNQSGKFAYVALPASQKEIQPGDLLTGDGKPYGSLIAAKVRARKDGGDVVAVTGGWVVRPKAPEAVAPIANAVPAAAPAATTEATADERTAVPTATEPATGDRSGPADDAGSVAVDGRLDAVPAPDVPAGNAATAGAVGNAGVGSRVDDAAVAPVLSTKVNKDGTVMVLGKPADIQAALPNGKGVAGKRGVMYGKRQAASVQKAVDAFNKNGPAAKPVKAKRRRTVDPERDTLLQAVAKYGGIDREEVAREFGLKPEELQHVVPAGNLKAYPFRKSGGMSIDGAIEALREDGYLDGVPADELRRTLEEAILAEMGGSPRLSTTGQMRSAEQHAADAAKDAADHEAGLLADEAAELERLGASYGLTPADLAQVEDDDIPGFDDNFETDPRALAAFLGETYDEAIHDQQARTDSEGRSQASPQEDRRDAAREAPAPAGTDGEAARGDAALTLTAPTPEELQAKATAEAKAQAADKAEQKRLADKAKADSERGEFTLTGSDSASDVAAAAGQDDLFSAPTPATQAAEILDAANITGKDRIDAIKDVKAGTITADELKAAYPAKDKPAAAVERSPAPIARSTEDKTKAELLAEMQDNQPDGPSEAALSDAEAAVEAVLTAADKALLADHYGDASYGESTAERFLADVLKAINGGIESVSKALHGILSRVVAVVLSIGVVFNPNLTSETKAAVFSSPQEFVIKGVKLPAVPIDAASRMSPAAKIAYQTLYAGLKDELQATDKLLIITDKPSARVFVFMPDGKLLMQDKVLVGAAKGDRYVGNNDVPTNRITPAGLFTMQLTDNPHYDFGKTLSTKNRPGDYSVTLFHSVWTHEADGAQRTAALKNDTIADSRYSFGCINVAKATYGDLLSKHQSQMDGAKLFVVPDNQAAVDEFLSGAIAHNEKGASDDLTRSAVPRVTETPDRTIQVGAATSGGDEQGIGYRRDLAYNERRRQAQRASRKRVDGNEGDVDSITQAHQDGEDQTETPAFKRWFGASKVVDAKGRPLVVYHGSPDARFVKEGGIFETMKERMLKWGSTPESRKAAADERGFFFTSSRATAKSYANPKRAFDYQNSEEAVIPAFVSLQNPMVVDAGGKHWREVQKGISKDDFISAAKKAGHDGVVIKNVRDNYDSLDTGRDPASDVVVAFASNQIKHATDNSGAFDPADSNINAREDAPTEYGDPPTEESAKVQAGLQGKTLLQAADWLAENAPPEMGLIAQAARKQLGRLQLAGAKFTFKIAHMGDQVPRLLLGSRGITSYRFGESNGKGEIDVWLNGADVTGKVGVSYETAIHEIVHAATMAAVRLGNLRSQAGTPLAKHVSDLYAVTNFVRAEFNKRVDEARAGTRILTDFEQRMFARANNAFADANETITWALTDKDAQTFLESIEYKGKTAWTAFVQVVRSLLGLSPKADTALSEILRISEELLNDETHTLTEGMLSRDGKDTVMQRGMTDMTLPQGDSQEQTETPAFKRWFGDSRVVDADGKPLVVYHGTPNAGFDTFDPTKAGARGMFDSARAGIYFTSNSDYANGVARSATETAPGVYPVYLSISNPLNVFSTELTEPAEVDAMIAQAKAGGHDGIADEYGNFVVFRPEQIKSAIGNNGDFDPSSSIITAHQSTGPTAGQPSNRDRIADKLRNAGGGPKIIGNTGRAYTPTQLAAMRAVGFQVQAPTLEDRAKAVWKDAGKKLAQGLVDQFAPIKEISSDAYSLLRLAKGASGAFEAMLQGGKLKLSDGVYDFDETQRGGVVDTLLKPLGGEHHDFFRWVAANRAERLLGEGKEHLFTPDDIKALKTLADGTSSFDYEIQHGANAGAKTRDRSLIYADALKTFNGFNKNVLDLAEQSGLIDGESRKLWEHEFYVPFYRVAEDEGGGIGGVNIKGGAVRQQAFKQLKGGKQALNADLMDNTLMNWAHLLDASAKNRAAVATLAAAENMGIAVSAPEATAREMASSVGKKSNVVWVMDGGQKHFYTVDDPYVMTALTSLEYAGMRSPIMKALGSFKHALTLGVTASPFFKVRNLIRDSVQAIGSAPLSYNVAGNLAQGWKLTDPKSDAYFRLLAGGGTIHFGAMMEGSESKRVQALVEAGVDAGTILNSDQKVKAFYRKFIEPSIHAYNELGNRGEAINRAALYAQLVEQGMSHRQASLQARDLMDFSMQGSFNSVRFLTQVVPFFNARLQGLYKLVRAAKEDPARISTVIGATALAGLGLMLAYSDDDDWRKREDWDRNNFWWFKFGGTAFRIPKPFEVGAIATLAERGFELAFDKEMDSKRFRSNVLALLGDNLSMNPIPQLAKPLLDVYANKDGFTGRPIETMGMEKLKADYRFTSSTSMAARGISTAANAVTGLVGAQTLSPVQVDALLKGYFGWLGAFVVGAGDVIARPLTNQPTQPDSDLFKAATGGMASDLRDAPSRYVSQMYAQATEVEQAYGTWKMLLKTGKPEEAAEFLAENRDTIGKYKTVEKVKKAEATLSQQTKRIEHSEESGQTKRELIRDLLARKDKVARSLSDV